MRRMAVHARMTLLCVRIEKEPLAQQRDSQEGPGGGIVAGVVFTTLGELRRSVEPPVGGWMGGSTADSGVRPCI